MIVRDHIIIRMRTRVTTIDVVIFAFVVVCVNVRALIFLLSPVYAVLVTSVLYVCVLAFLAV